MAFFLHLITIVSLLVPAVLGYNVVFGKAKVLHFGPIGSSLVAAYGVYSSLALGMPLPFAILCGAVLTTVLAFCFARLALRMTPDGMGVLSLASHLAILTVVLNWSSVTRGALGLTGIARPEFLQNDIVFTSTCVSVALLWALLLWRLDRGPFGRSLGALAEHPWYAGALGVQEKLVVTQAFLLAGLGALLSNVLSPMYYHLLYPTDYGFPLLIFYVMVIVAGKPGSVGGVSLSLVLLTLLREGLRFLPLPASQLGPLRLFIFGAILLVAVWWRRDVLFPKQRNI